MMLTRVHRCLAILCLVAFGLGQTVLASMGVRCTDASGQTRFELACIKSGQGSCLTTCQETGAEQAEDPHDAELPSSVPCEDEPLNSHAPGAKLIPSGWSLEPVVTAVVETVLWDTPSRTLCDPECSRFAERDRVRPPDPLTQLRCVILIV